MDTDGLDDFLDTQGFCGVVLVRDGDRVVYEAATGLASRHWDIPNTLGMRFDTASVTKLFTSVAVLQQVEQGTLDLETSIHHYVDLAGTTIGVDVTLLHLLTHTSGIADDADEEAGEKYELLWVDKPTYSVMETVDFLPQFAHKLPSAPPGVVCRYNNVGFVLAGLALEKVTSMPYREYVRDNVFARAGMADSGFFDRRDAAPRVAEGWGQHADGRWYQNIFSYPPIGSPDGGAHTTASDLVRFIDAARVGALLGEEFTQEFFTPQVEHDPGTMYGFGLEFDMEEDGSVRSYYKEGSNPGVAALVRHYVESGMDVAVLANQEKGAWQVVREIDERFGG